MAYGDVHEKIPTFRLFFMPSYVTTEAFFRLESTIYKASALNRGRLWRE